MKFSIKKGVVILLVFWLCPIFLIAQCPDNLYVSLQSSIERFQDDYPECEHMTGEITITGQVENLFGLGNLKSVEGIEVKQTEKLTSLEGLNNLTSLEYIHIFDAQSLKDLSALDNLTSVDRISISDTEAEYLPDLSNVQGGVTSFYIRDNAELLEVDFPDNLSNSGDVWITRNESLKSISGFNKTTKLEDIWIWENDSLEIIDGFENLDSVISFAIRDHPELNTLSKFPNLINVENTIDFSRNLSLEKIEGFNNLKEAGLLSFRENKIKQINGFEKLDSVSNILIRNENELEEFIGPNNLRTVETIIIEESGMSSISGFQNLTRIGESIVCRFNPELSEITGFQNLTELGGVIILGNPKLTDCSAICNYIDQFDGFFWGTFQNNGEGCSSVSEVTEACIDSIGEITTLNVHLNTANGNHTTSPLKGLSVELYEEDVLKETLVSNENGIVEINNDELDEEKNYRIITFHGDNTEPRFIYDNITAEEISKDKIEISYPKALLDSIYSYQKKLDNRIIKADYISGGIPLSYPSLAYDVSGLGNVTIFYEEISEDHPDKIEEMKRLGLGLYVMNLYLDDAIRLTALTSKSLFESTYNSYKFLKELNSLQAVVEKFKEEYASDVIKKAMDESMKAQMKLVYHSIKKFIINPYIASLEQSPATKDYAKYYKLLLALTEEAIFREGALLENAFLEVVYNAGAEYLLDQFYINRTQGTLSALEFNHANIDNDFSLVVQNANSIINQTNLDIITYEEDAEFNSNYGMDIDALAGYIQNLGLAVAIFSGGSLAPIGGAMHEFAKGLKLGTLSLNGINNYNYAARLVGITNEVDQIIQNIGSSPFNNSDLYEEELIDALLTSLANNADIAISNLSDFKTILDNGSMSEIAEQYLLTRDFLEFDFAQSLENGYAVIQNMGLSENGGQLTSETFNLIMESYRKIETQRFLLDIELMALFFDVENEEIKSDYLAEIDLYIGYLESIEDEVAMFIGSNLNNEYPPLLLVNSFTYPDSFSMDPFSAEIQISNFGAAVTLPFSVNITANEHCNVTILDEQIEGLVLESGESKTILLEVESNSTDDQSALYIEFEGERGIDESLRFNFPDQTLNFGNTTSTLDISGLKVVSNIYPNPTNETINVNPLIQDKIQRIQVLTLQGRLVKTSVGNLHGINVAELPIGPYMVKIILEDTELNEIFIKN